MATPTSEYAELMRKHLPALKHVAAAAQESKAAQSPPAAPQPFPARKDSVDMTEQARPLSKPDAVAESAADSGASKVIERNLDNDSNRKIVESFLASIPAATEKR